MPAIERVQSLILRTALFTAVLCSMTVRALAQTHYEGALGPGSLYEIDVPAS